MVPIERVVLGDSGRECNAMQLQLLPIKQNLPNGDLMNESVGIVWIPPSVTE